MGLIGCMARCLFKIIIVFGIFASFVIFTPNLPPYGVTFTEYNVSQIRKLEGPLKLNGKLNNVERLYESMLKGPESLVYKDGTMYTGVHGGLVIAIKDNALTPLVKFGKACDGIHEEEICGRPLGLYMDAAGSLYVADAYYGLFKVNTTTKLVEQLVHPSALIEGKKPKVFNSVAVASDNKVYWSDSDSNVDLRNLFFSIFGDGSGRLIKYDPVTKKNEVLIKNLVFANGVALAQDESYVIVAETFAYRVLRYYLKGPKKNTFDVFVDGLPGNPDNIKRDAHGNFYISLVIAKDEEHTPSIILNIGQYPLVRKFISRSIGLLQEGLSILDSFVHHEFLRKTVHALGHCETWAPLIPPIPRVTIVKVDKNGKIIDSLHSLDKSTNYVCEIEFAEGYAYLASPFNNYLGRVKL